MDPADWFISSQFDPTPNDILIELWHHGAHWCQKKRGEQYWYKGEQASEWFYARRDRASRGGSP